MAVKTDVAGGYSSTVRKTLSYDKWFPLYEATAIVPGQGADGYDVDTTGGMFSTVVTSGNTIIKNRAGNSDAITVYLNTDGTSPIHLAAGESITVDCLDVTNIFLDTGGAFGAGEYVDIVLFGRGA